MERGLSARLISAFWAYGWCCARMEDALIERSEYPKCRTHGPHFGILVQNDTCAKEYRRWKRRAEIIEEWVETYEEASEKGEQGG